MLLADDNISEIDTRLGVIYDKFAQFKEKSTVLLKNADDRTKAIILEMELIAKDMRNEVLNCSNKIKDEQKNLIVVHEILSKTMKRRSKDVKDQSFQLEI